MFRYCMQKWYELSLQKTLFLSEHAVYLSSVKILFANTKTTEYQLSNDGTVTPLYYINKSCLFCGKNYCMNFRTVNDG